MTSTEQSAPARKGRPARIDQDKIVRCALEIGISNVSMHAVARKLGVSTTALYRHVRSKQALIALCTDMVSHQVTVPSTDNWEEHLYALARAYRQAALALPGSVDFIRHVGLATPAACEIINHSLGILRDAGFSADGAYMACAGVISHATDMVLHEEQAARTAAEYGEGGNPDFISGLAKLDEFPNLMWVLSENFAVDHERNFETGLTIIIEGLKAVYPEAGR